MLLIISVLFVVSATFLLYLKSADLETASPRLRKFAVPASQDLVATFMGT
jgi:hypothetical protein